MKHLFNLLILILFSSGVYAGEIPCGAVGANQVAAQYTASDGSQLEVCFDLAKKTVSVHLPNIAVVTLPSSVSGSGARYSDETHIFWEHQGTARYYTGEKLLFEGQIKPHAAYKSGVTSKILIKTDVTADGKKIVYPLTDRPEVTAALVEIAPGKETGWHKHLIPVYAYMLEGELKVKLEVGKDLTYKAGDVIIEVVDCFHNGINTGKTPVRLVAFYIGNAGQPNVIKKSDPYLTPAKTAVSR